jgi:two-component system OmpR family sensor kinase
MPTKRMTSGRIPARPEAARARPAAVRSARGPWLDGFFLTRTTHLLKNHAAAAKVAFQLLLDHGAAADGTARARWRTAFRDSTEGLHRLLDQLEQLGLALAPVAAPVSRHQLGPWLRERVRHVVATEPAARSTLAAGRVPAGRWRFAAGAATVALDCLLRNALLHPSTGTRASVSARASRGGITFRVTDDGAGIPADEAPELFQPFFRGAAARDLPGAGLGLALARASAAHAGGRIAHSPGRPRGTCFELFLPAARLTPSRSR